MKQFKLILLLCLISMSVSANPVDRLIERIAPGNARKFKTMIVKQDKDFFELSQAGSKVCIKGNTWVNIATGLHWYLKYYCGKHLTWNNMRIALPAVLPKVARPERHETDLKLRYDFNYCTFSYSMAFWDWKRWETEIDWMALHGINMPLAIVGEECVWRNMLLRLGYNNEEIGKFIAGPAFLAWFEMNNLEGWGGPLPDSWYAQQEVLQKKILKRMRAFGMHPVLPGYCGMLPHDAKEKLGVNATDGGTWNGYTRPANLSATDPHFDRIADIYYDELTKLYGQADYYSMDPFHESKDADIDYALAGKKLLAAMKRANPRSTWVVQGWTENPRPQMINDLAQGDLLILDLFSECRPMFGAPSVWRREGGYGKHFWAFCMLENFGANVGLHGRMDQLLNNWKLAMEPSTGNPKTLKGIGLTMEGSENNPIMFELMTELPWRGNVNKAEWVANYVRARYGLNDLSNKNGNHEESAITQPILKAWEILSNTIYNCPAGNNQQGPSESIFDGRPSLNNFQVKSWSKMHNYYDPASTLEAARLMNSVAAHFRGNNNFEYDLVDITRQALDDQARKQYLHTIADYNGMDFAAFSKDSARFLNMLLLQDSLLGTRKEFRLGHWIEAARKLGNTEAEKNLYEWNARVQITTWGNRLCADQGGLRDYAHKEWQGLLKDFYYVRWHTYLDALSKQMYASLRPDPSKLGGGPNANKTSSELFQLALPHGPEIDWYAIEEPWTRKHNSYSSEPAGDAIEMAQKVIEKLKNDL